MKKILWLLSLILISSIALADTKIVTVNHEDVYKIATATNCLSHKISLTNPTIWYTQATLSITNNCTSPQNLDMSLVSFQSNSTNMTAMWGGQNSSAAFSYKGNIASTLLNIKNDPLPVGKTLTLNFGINLNGVGFDVTAANDSLQVTSAIPPTPTDGVIEVTVNPAGVSGMNGGGQIDITGIGLSKPYSIINSNWTSPSTYTVAGLAYGTYTISPKPLGTLYTGIASPATVNITSATAVKTNVTYQALPATGTLQINLGAAPLSELGTTVYGSLNDNTTKQNQLFNIAWKNSVVIPNLAAGHIYVVTLPQVTNGVSLSKPAPISNPIITTDKTTTLNVTYQPAQAVPNENVTFNVSGLPANTYGNLSITDSFGTIYTKTGFNNGAITQALPINNTFAVTASATNMNATVTPPSFTFASGKVIAINVNFTPKTTTVASSHFLAYSDTGMQSSNNGLVPPKSAHMTEAFILYNPWQKKTTLWAIEPGDAISQIIVKTPNTFASVGGAVGPYPWDYQTVAQAVTDIKALVDYFHFTGLDFDVEGAALETPTVQNWVAQAVVQLRKERPNLILTLTVPDPVIGFTNGTIAILNLTLKANGNKMVFDWVNKMDFNHAGLGNGCTQTDTNMNNNCLIISAVTGAQQLATMLNITNQQAYQYLGEIFMVPADDQGHPLSMTLAAQVATHLKGLGLTRMGYWRIQNDPGLAYGNQFCKILGLQ